MWCIPWRAKATNRDVLDHTKPDTSLEVKIWRLWMTGDYGCRDHTSSYKPLSVFSSLHLYYFYHLLISSIDPNPRFNERSPNTTSPFISNQLIIKKFQKTGCVWCKKKTLKKHQKKTQDSHSFFLISAYLYDAKCTSTKINYTYNNSDL